MTQDLSKLSQYTGLSAGLCALFLFLIAVTLVSLLKAFHNFHAEYVKINTLYYGDDEPD